MTKSVREWTDDDFQRFADQVLVYELKELRKSIRAMAVLGTDSPRQSHWNALVESFAIHTRNLIEFVHHKPEKGRVGAEHYGVALGEKEELNRLYGQVSAQVAHVTQGRLDLQIEHKRYATEQIKILVDRLRLYVQKCPEERMGQEFRKLVFIIR